MVELDVRNKIRFLRERTQASLLWCRDALKQTIPEGDVDQAIKLLEERIKKEGRNFTPHPIPARIMNGITIADVNITGDIGILLTMTCITESCANSDLFKEAVDMIGIIALNEKPKTICQLLGASLDSINSFLKDKSLEECFDVSDYLAYVRGRVKESITIDYYSITEIDKNDDPLSFISIYNNNDGKRASLCILRSEDSITKDLKWLYNRITNAIACYNPLCVKEHELPISILNHEKELAIKELTPNEGVTNEDDQKVLDNLVKWKINGFLDEVVLERIKIQSEPFSSSTPIASGQVPFKTIKEICKIYKINLIDFDCSSVNVNTI